MLALLLFCAAWGSKTRTAMSRERMWIHSKHIFFSPRIIDKFDNIISIPSSLFSLGYHTSPHNTSLTWWLYNHQFNEYYAEIHFKHHFYPWWCCQAGFAKHSVGFSAVCGNKIYYCCVLSTSQIFQFFSPYVPFSVFQQSLLLAEEEGVQGDLDHWILRW